MNVGSVRARQLRAPSEDPRPQLLRSPCASQTVASNFSGPTSFLIQLFGPLVYFLKETQATVLNNECGWPSAVSHRLKANFSEQSTGLISFSSIVARSSSEDKTQISAKLKDA